MFGVEVYFMLTLFRITRLSLKDTQNILFSKNLYTLASYVS